MAGPALEHGGWCAATEPVVWMPEGWAKHWTWALGPLPAPLTWLFPFSGALLGIDTQAEADSGLQWAVGRSKGLCGLWTIAEGCGRL